MDCSSCSCRRLDLIDEALADVRKQLHTLTAEWDKITTQARISRLYGITDQQLVRQSDIARLAGVTEVAVHRWRERYPDFPQAVYAEQGKHLWDRGEVEEWLRETGRMEG